MTIALSVGLDELDAEVAQESLKSIFDWILGKLASLLRLALGFKENIVKAVISRSTDLRTLRERIKLIKGKAIPATRVELPKTPNFYRNSNFYVDSWVDIIAGINLQNQVVQDLGHVTSALTHATPYLVRAIDEKDESFRMIDRVRVPYNQLVSRSTKVTMLDGSKIDSVDDSLQLNFIYGQEIIIGDYASLPTPHPVLMEDMVAGLERLSTTIRKEHGVEGVRRATHRLQSVVQSAQRDSRASNPKLYYELGTILHPINLYLELLHRSSAMIDEHVRILWVATEEYQK